jgi:hypothetical protein
MFSVGLGGSEDAPAARATISFAPFGVDFYLGSGKTASNLVLQAYCTGID